jgi:tripartite-type tricarboxylate transporter receptor subunit TctC
MVVPFAAGAPPELVTRLYSESIRVLADTEIKKRFDDVGLEAVGMPTEAFARYVEKDAAEMRELAHKIGLARKN